MSTVHDLVILGAGSGGYACALRGAQLGLSVALVERAKIGGTCLHEGCIPTKALLHAAEVADTVREAAAVGVRASADGIDMEHVLRYQQAVVSRLYKGLTGLVTGRGIEVVEGEGRLVSADTVAVGDRQIQGRNIVLATGSAPRHLPQVPIGGRIVTSTEALQLTTVPRRVIVLGGGVIGVEFASVFRSFGAEVTVVEALDRLVAAEEPAISAALQRAFRKRRITVRAGVAVAGAEDGPDDVTVQLADGTRLTADLLLVAVGRVPVTAGMGYDAAGIGMDGGYVLTDERLRTNVAGVYAVGDIVPGLQLAHRGFAHGVFVAEEIAGQAPQPVLDRTIPRVTYCDPEIASVGLTEDQAREHYGAATSIEYNLGGNGRSQILQTSGFVKVVRVPDGPVVGIHMIGARIGEQVGEAQLICSWEALPEEVAALVHAHPTQNEALGEAHMALAGRPLHAHA